MHCSAEGGISKKMKKKRKRKKTHRHNDAFQKYPFELSLFTYEIACSLFCTYIYLSVASLSIFHRLNDNLTNFTQLKGEKMQLQRNKKISFCSVDDDINDLYSFFCSFFNSVMFLLCHCTIAKASCTSQTKTQNKKERKTNRIYRFVLHICNCNVFISCFTCLPLSLW